MSKRLTFALSQIDAHLSDPRQRQLWHFAHAMFSAYATRYPIEQERFRVVHVELPTHGDILNPRTGAPSRAVMWSQKCDGVVQLLEDDSYWLMEHKTASRITSDYIERIWEDPQIFTYTDYLRRVEGIPIQGILYNVLAKPAKTTVQRVGETDEEYQARYAEAAAKTKNGKSSTKQKLPESDDEFQERLAAWYADPSRFFRQEILVNERQIIESRHEKWNIVQRYLQARRAGYWLRNRSLCKLYNSTCDYWNVCSCRPEDEESMIATFYRPKPAHEELADHLATIPDDVRNGREIFSHSRCAMFLSCEKKHYFRYEREIIPVEKSDNLTFGSAIHAALEAWYQPDGEVIAPLREEGQGTFTQYLQHVECNLTNSPF